MDTIYALASGQGKAGVAVLRISGPDAHTVCEKLAGRVPPFRRMSLASLRDPAGDVLDHALIVAFPAESSFTGELVTELHLHGSRAVVSAVMKVISASGMARLAEPGEFTRRALGNGKLDLTEVEGLSDLLAAETEVQRKQAMAVASGTLRRKVEGWREALIHITALIAATIDFADEELPDGLFSDAARQLEAILSDIDAELIGISTAERIRDGFRIAIIGAPNAGKSTLLNTLAGKEAAITSHIAGTTRDVIEVQMEISGLPVTLIDTAGLRESDDIIEQLGIERAKYEADIADLRVLLSVDGSIPENLELRPTDILLKSKADVSASDGEISGKTGAGIDKLLSRIANHLAVRVDTVGVATNDRHRIAMTEAKLALNSALNEINNGEERSEFASEYLRQATQRMSLLIGQVGVEDLLDDIFRNFCLGK